MLRGVSLAPQQRVVKDPQELPTELVNSIIGVAAHAQPDYGAAGSTGASGNAGLLSTAGGSQGGGVTATSPSFFARLFRRRRYQPNAAGQIPVFDANGNLTTSQTGVNTFRFRSLSLFYFFRSQPWTALITYSVLFYLLIVLLITASYYLWGMYCGAGLNMVASIYFTVVSLAANGGYLGEDEDTMTDSTHMCYRGRTFIVMFCSYVNIVFVGLVAALVVGKAEYTGKLGHRVVFSDFCTLTSIPGRVGQYRLAFRMANVDNNIPLAHGALRIFCVTAEPLKEYRLRQKQMHLLKNSAPMKGLAKTTWGSAQQLLPGGEATNSFRATPQPLTEAMLEGRRATHHHHKNNNNNNNNRHSARPPLAGGGGGGAAAAAVAGNTNVTATVNAKVDAVLAPPRSSSALEKDPQLTRQQQPRRRNPHSRHRKGRKSATTTGTLPNTSVTDPAATSGSGSRGRRGRGRRVPPDHSGSPGGSATARAGRSVRERNVDGDDVEERGGADSDHSRSSSASSSASTNSRTSTPSSSHSSSRASSRSSSSSSSSSTRSTGERGTRKTKSDPRTTEVNTTSAQAATGRGAASDITNSSMTSKQNSDLYAASPLGGMAGSFAGAAVLGKRTLSPASAAAAAAVKASQLRVQEDDDVDRELERVHLRVQEMRWTCAEESYLDRGDSGQLSLWYPVTITHTIDERSPLYSFMQLPNVAASLKEGPTSVFGSARSDDSSVHPPSLSNTPDSARHRFQLVAVFDATEMETGSTITAKHTYTTVDIVAHYKFSDRLVHMQADSGEVMLDFHYFNALLPVDLVELSTTDSEM